MFFKHLGKRLEERWRQILEALGRGGSWVPRPVPVPVRPSTPRPHRFQARRGIGVVLAALAVAGTTVAGSADDTVESPCAVCRVWNASMSEVPEDQVTLEAQAIENGVVLRATAREPEVRLALWNVSSHRQRLLNDLHQGRNVPLCPACRANLHAFDELRIDTVRLPDGVLLLYTSAQPEVVRRLHQMVPGTGLFL